MRSKRSDNRRTRTSGSRLTRVALFIACAAALAGCIPQGRAPAPRTAPGPRAENRPPANEAVQLPPQPPAASGPSWEAQRVAADARTIPAGSYRVVAGDTLRAIASKTGAGSEAIARANRLQPPFLIRPGQRLRIPAGRYHRVREGQTGIAIAFAYHVDWNRIIDLNALEPPYTLRTGMLLALPDNAEVAAMSLEQRAAAFSIDIGDIATGAEPATAEDEPPPPPPARSPAVAVPSTRPVGEPGRFNGRFEWPLTGRILTRFGPGGGGRVNQGIKIAATRGAPIRAAADGVVAYAGAEIAIYGGLVLIRHGDGWITAYGHAERIGVVRGQAVKRGDVIGYAGETGSAREPQLHFEIRHNRTPIDPLRELPQR
ncbi:peptidoglycan DD-metalloendopeptidase family protein [Sphingomonas sanxanigenens]|uniref:LysM domain-containing protein n=1 Tax=Sphingomonas sanxanigenens DSM 19645 = NX02 TaxID=1123269 RepID=W0A9M4_9SPHN|nr:peptidoglycan DD-metalloendopeptidase family protein [Sphingomonas sanxanigenens]AHE53801.1 hypothetical protein NX02_10420 [Sphingomonas sanxanigenens DSM 19645 = NX02]